MSPFSQPSRRSARFIGQSFIGDYAPIVPSLVRMVVVYLLTFVMVYIIACVINVLAPRFGGRKNFANALKLSVYSHTPLWLAGIFLLIPGLNFLLILGVYGLYLFWIGLPLLMQVPDDKALPYAAVATGCALVSRARAGDLVGRRAYGSAFRCRIGRPGASVAAAATMALASMP